MEKYSRVSKITHDYLHGKLARLKIDYEDQNLMSLSIVYEDTNHYWFDYDITLDLANQQVEHASHYSEGYLNKVNLNREVDFEKAICNELFELKPQLS